MESLTAVKLAWQPLKMGSCVSSELSISRFIHYGSLSAVKGLHVLVPVNRADQMGAAYF